MLFRWVICMKEISKCLQDFSSSATHGFRAFHLHPWRVIYFWKHARGNMGVEVEAG